MSLNKVAEIIHSFTPGEKKELQGFLQWRVRPSEIYVTKLLKLLSNQKNAQQESHEKLHAALFGEKAYDPQHLYTACSDLLVYIKEYLVYLSVKEYSDEKDILYLAELEKRSADHTFDLEKNSILRSLQKKPLQDSNMHLHLFRIYELSDRQFMKKQKREYDASLQMKIDNLDVFYFSTKLKEACEVINRHNIIGEKYTLSFIREIVDFIHQHKELQKHPSLLIYSTIWNMITSNDTTHYYTLKKLLSLLHHFTPDESRNIVNYAMNYCIRKINTGHSEFHYEAFELYGFQLESGIIFQNKYLTQWDYKNIITVAIRLKKYDWTENFIHQYKNKIEPEFRENAFNYNQANFYYEKKEYRKAVRILNEVSFTDIYYALNARSLLLKTYLELEDYETLIQLCDAFKIYLVRNKKISSYQKTIHINLVKYVRKLAMYQTTLAQDAQKKKIAADVISRLEQSQDVANINWIKEVWQKSAK